MKRRHLKNKHYQPYHLKQCFHPYTKWEDYKAGMWRDVSKEEEEQFFENAVKFTGNPDLYGSWMLKVIEIWKYSCEQNLSDVQINRQAWIGQAACCLALGCPEYITRQAWNTLTKTQQDKANKKADEAIKAWEMKQYEKISQSRCFYRNTKQSILGV